MRKRIAIVVGIALGIVLVGYGVYSVLFTQPVDAPKPAKVAPATPTPTIKAAPVEEVPVRDVEILSVKGKVERQLGPSKWALVKEGDRITMEDSVQTHENASAMLGFDEDSRLEIMPNSGITLKKLSSKTTRIRINHGRLTTETSGRAGSKFEVETQGSEAVAESVKGKMSVLADGAGQLTVAADKGDAKLTNKNRTVVVSEGMQTTAQADAVPTAPEPIPKSLFLKVARIGKDVIRRKETTIKGRTNPGVVVSINGIRMTVDKEGRFSGTVPLKEGKNQLKVSGVHVTGMEKERMIPTVMVDTRPPQVKSAVKWGKDRSGGP